MDILNIMSLQHFEHKFRPYLQKFLPKKAFITLYSVARTKALKSFENFTPKSAIKADTKPTILFDKLNFRNDLGNAAGFDKDGSLLAFNYKIGAGFAVVGTVLNKEHTGNLYTNYGFESNMWTPLPHSDSAINSLGLPSKGINTTLDNIKRFQDTYQPKNFPIGLSIMGHPLDEGYKKHDGVLECIEKAKAHVDFFEINESCPNVCHKESDLSELQQRLKTIHQSRLIDGNPIPVLIKMGVIPDAKALLEILNAENIEGLVALNTQTDYENLKSKLDQNDTSLFDTYTQNFKGGVSGKVIANHTMNTIKSLHEINETLNKKLVLVHVGGISTKEDINHSRQFAPLREWYTCFMSALGSKEWETIYPDITK